MLRPLHRQNQLGKERTGFESIPTSREEANFERRGPREIHATQGSPLIPRQDGSTGPRGSTGENSSNDFRALASRITELNTLIDLPKMIKEYDLLIDRIKKANSNYDKKVALYEFFGGNGDCF
ncbi:hypothetical protein JTB14_019237 [Gonioctena quinquepunctata]|nr:hypothetical protein JTB14_019237 [Gonioctena quinquepunctata]